MHWQPSAVNAARSKRRARRRSSGI